ncbi:MAG: alpha/beta fold hydrolase [bacterium]|nr:alpha/beta fold hydrolase [bacterium]
MPFADLGDIRIHYLDNRRDAAPIVFLHGFTLDHRSWAPQTRFFDKDYHVIVMDSRGHGQSDAPATGYARSDRVLDLLKLLDCLHIEKIHLVGLSMGGSTGIGFALDHSDRLLSLTLASTGAAGYSPGSKISRIDQIAREQGIDTAREVWIKTSLKWYGEEKKEIRDLMLRMMREHSGAIWADQRRGAYPRFIDLDHVSEISVPTNIMVGERDRIFLPLARQLHELIEGSQLHLFKDVGHMVNLEAPKQFNRKLKAFLEGVPV